MNSSALGLTENQSFNTRREGEVVERNSGSAGESESKLKALL